jgi:hypothetical protein
MYISRHTVSTKDSVVCPASGMNFGDAQFESRPEPAWGILWFLSIWSRKRRESTSLYALSNPFKSFPIHYPSIVL